MCGQAKCKGCGKPKQSCTLKNGLCYSCREPKKTQTIQPKLVIPPPQAPIVQVPIKYKRTLPNRPNRTTSNNVYHTV